jgi:uncharacterized damage-inducible protein DinB
MNDLADARSLAAYARWANALILTAAARLSAEALTRDLRSSFPSVRDTLVHTLWSEWIWLERLRGRSPREVFDYAGFPTVAAIRTRWSTVEDGYAAVLDPPDVDLVRPVTYTNRKGEQWTYPIGQILRHVANHGTHHRGQLVTMLRQLGEVPPTTDYLVFVDVGAPGASRGSSVS